MPRAKCLRFVPEGFAVLVLLFSPGHARSGGLDRLLDLLVKKRILTEGEAASLRAEVTGSREKPIQSSPPARESGEPLAPHDQAASQRGGPVSASTPISLSGYVQLRATAVPNSDRTFEVRRARVVLSGDLAQKVEYKIHVDAFRSPVLLDARIDWRYRPWARITFGQFKVPFSQESLASSRDLIPIERSQVVNNLAPGRDNDSTGRDIGAQLEGSLPGTERRPLLDYSVGIFNGAGINQRDENRRKDGAARLVLHPAPGLSLAGDYYNGSTGVEGLSKERAGAEIAYDRKPFYVGAELIWGHDDAVRRRGWYALGAYRFRPRWEGLFRLDNFTSDLHTPGNAANTYLLGLNWYASRWLKLQANYGLVDHEARARLRNTFLSQVQFQF